MNESPPVSVLCLHGFPQNMHAFDRVAEVLEGHGHQVIRYDQRGYTGGDEPLGSRSNYTVGQLALDAIAALDKHSVSKCIVVGHDLGGLVAWEVSRRFPERVEGLVVVSVPHPGAFLLALGGVVQAWRAWYFVLAQSTLLATRIFSPTAPASRQRFVRRLEQTGLPSTASERYLDHLSVGNRFERAVRWYQAMPLSSPSSSFFRTKVPTELIWGTKDALTTRLAIRLSRLFDKNSRLGVTEVLDGTHWLLDEAPATVAGAVCALTIDEQGDHWERSRP